MRIRSVVIHVILLASLAGCSAPESFHSTATPGERTVLQDMAAPSPELVTFTATPMPTLTLTPTATSTPEPTAVPYCDGLYESYTPAEGFKLYCDEQYKYAFEYPLGWEVEGLDRPTPDPTEHPGAYPQVLTFYAPDNLNWVYIHTGVIPEGLSLKELAQNDHAYDDRAFKNDYSPMRIAGKPAYGFVNRYVQDYSGVTLYFEHGEYYTIMYMKIITRKGLDVDWQIARSIQVPGATPADNVIPAELIEDSRRLL